MPLLLAIVVTALCFLSSVDTADCPAKTLQNTDPAGCKCGTANQCKENQFCDQPNDICSDDPFCSDDKTIQSTIPKCKCKDQTCSNADYCDITGNGKCIKACTTDKNTKTPDECGCSKQICTVDKYCDASGNGACNDTPPTALPACPTDKTKQVPDAQCMCKTQTCVKGDYCDEAGNGGSGACDKSPPPAAVKACPTDKAAQITEATCTCSSQTCKNGQYCDSTGGGTCSDNPPTPALPICPAPPNPTLVDCQCLSATCKRGDKCTNGACSQERDLDPNCFRYAGLCNNAAYKKQMQDNCAATCARQNGFLPPAPCLDRDANCPTWPTFCRNSYYTYEQKKYYCQRTCNMC